MSVVAHATSSLPWVECMQARDARPSRGRPDVPGRTPLSRLLLAVAEEPRGHVEPQSCMPATRAQPVQMMISVRAGRSSFTAFRVAVTRVALRPFFAGAWPDQGRMSPLACALKRSTT